MKKSVREILWLILNEVSARFYSEGNIGIDYDNGHLDRDIDQALKSLSELVLAEKRDDYRDSEGGTLEEMDRELKSWNSALDHIAKKIRGE